MIIVVDGVQGSGKSYICKKLTNIRCIDTDDIMYKCVDIIEHEQLPRTQTSINKLSKGIVNKYIKDNSNIVFVGMTINIPNYDYKYFIKLTDPETTYRRLMIRELDKIIKNKNKIKKHINDTNDVNMINVPNCARLSVIFPSYKEFMQDYKERLNNAKKQGYIIKTQRDIIQDLTNQCSS